MRQVILDTETTGLSFKDGHRVIEIGCLEMISRRLTGKVFHTYLNPGREIDPGAMRVHGITNAFVQNQPKFEAIEQEFKDFINGAELVIHNAPFDVGFLDNEFIVTKNEWKTLTQYCTILDTLSMARKMHPGQKNNLDALCKRYSINNTHRTLHGALLDSEILAELYLAMTGGQTVFDLALESAGTTELEAIIDYSQLPIIKASHIELKAHQQFLITQLKKGVTQTEVVS